MNKTKKLTTGAMLLAIVGALMLLDRQFSYLFDVYIVMMIPVVIIIYAAMYELKDGGILCVCLGILTFIIGSSSLNYVFYVPLGIIVGLGYSYFLKKNANKQRLMLASVVLYTAGEVLITFVLMPILGFDIVGQISSIKEAFLEIGSGTGMDFSLINLDALLPAVYVFTIILTGVMEGFLTHVVTLLLLRKFKIKSVDAAAIMPLEPGTGMTYGCIALVFLMYIYNNFLSDMVNNELVKYIVLCAGMMAFMVLVYFGYIYLAVYLKLRFGKNMTLFLMLGLILFFPLSLFILMIVGFLYGSGPLKKYIIINKK